MKLVLAISIAVFSGLLLYGLYQYKAHNKTWGIKLVVWLCALLLPVGIGLRSKSVYLAVAIVVAVALSCLCWRLTRNRLDGWKQHALRGLVIALLLGPIIAIRYRVLVEFGEYHELITAGTASDAVGFFLYGIPGFILAGIIASLLSLFMSRSKPAQSPKRNRLAVAAMLLVLCPCVNWYVAGSVDMHPETDDGNVALLRYAILSRPGLVNAKDNDGWNYGCAWTPLHYASRRGHAKTAQALIQAGADINAKDKVGWTPLHYASSRGHAKTAQVLIKAGAGADINAKDKVGSTPLDKGDEDTKQLLRKHGGKTGEELEAQEKAGQPKPPEKHQ